MLILEAHLIPPDLLEFFEPVEWNAKGDTWTVATEAFPESHFATYPTALIQPCIKAGTSERGVCPECGAPWVRVVERGELRDLRVRGADGEAPKHEARIDMGLRSNRTGLGESNSHTAATPQSPEIHTTGWRPSCKCACAPCEGDGVALNGVRCPTCDGYGRPTPVPATVLDPFFGAGTTGLVADRLNRDCIGIELNPAYAAMAQRRINGEAPMFSDVSVA